MNAILFNRGVQLWFKYKLLLQSLLLSFLFNYLNYYVFNIAFNLLFIINIIVIYIVLNLLQSKFIQYLERYQNFVNNKLKTFLIGGNFINPFRLYIFFYLVIFLAVRSIFIWITEKGYRLWLFCALLNIVTFYCLASRNVYWVVLGLIIPLTIIWLDIQSSIVASFFNKNPNVQNKLFNTPIFSSPRFPFKGPFKRMIWKAITALGGPKVLVPASVTVVGGVIGFISYQAFETHRQEKSLENENKKWAYEKKLSPEYNGSPSDSSIKTDIDYVAREGKFPKK